VFFKDNLVSSILCLSILQKLIMKDAWESRRVLTLS
jgi:hypothetical protein